LVPINIFSTKYQSTFLTLRSRWIVYTSKPPQLKTIFSKVLSTLETPIKLLHSNSRYRYHHTFHPRFLLNSHAS